MKRIVIALGGNALGDNLKEQMSAGQIAIAAGGGIPVAMRDGQYHGMNAVIDKDFSAAKLAEVIEADMLIILTLLTRARDGIAGKTGTRITL